MGLVGLVLIAFEEMLEGGCLVWVSFGVVRLSVLLSLVSLTIEAESRPSSEVMEEEEEILLLVNDGVVVVVSAVVEGVPVMDKSMFFIVVLLGVCIMSFVEEV